MYGKWVWIANASVKPDGSFSTTFKAKGGGKQYYRVVKSPERCSSAGCYWTWTTGPTLSMTMR